MSMSQAAWGAILQDVARSTRAAHLLSNMTQEDLKILIPYMENLEKTRKVENVTSISNSR